MRLSSAPRLTAFACALVALAEASDASAQEPAGVVAPPPAAADPRERARVLANQAADAIARGEYEQAEELLGQAYVHYPAPTIALLHARTLLHLQRLSAAASVYERATLTSLGPDAPPAFQRAVEQARQEAQELRPRVPRLQIVVRGKASAEPRLRVTVDGRLVPEPQRGRWILVDPGRRVVRAELDGAISEQVVRVAERQSIVVDVSDPVSQRAAYKALTWASLGLGVAGVATGVATGVAATSAYRRAEESCPTNRCLDGSAGAKDYRRFRTYRVVSTLGYAVGAAGVAMGGYLLIRSALDGPALQLDLDQHGGRLTFGGVL